MAPKDIKRLKIGDELVYGAFEGRVTCVDLVTDDRVVIKWDAYDSEDVVSDQSPLWSGIQHK
jgi:hypothetical protein